MLDPLKEARFRAGLAVAVMVMGLVVPAKSQSAGANSTINRVDILNRGNNFELEIHASSTVQPQTQVITGPDRLIVDFPNSIPGRGLHPLIVSAGAIKGIRMGLFQSSPPVTRVVVDLKSPQAYRVFPSGRSVIVKIMPPDGHAAEPPVQTAMATGPAAPPLAPAQPAPPHLQVELRNGRLKIWSNRASLAEVLREVQRLTGAKVTIPPGADQDVVVADIGPAPPREALTTLLSGSPYNIILLGAEGDLSKVTNIILTSRGPGGDQTINFPASVTENTPDTQPEPPPPVQEVPPEPPPQPDAEQPPPPQQ